MAEKRTEPKMVLLEPSIVRILHQVLEAEGETVSGYLRGLVIKDLRRKGKLTDTELLKMVM